MNEDISTYVMHNSARPEAILCKLPDNGWQAANFSPVHICCVITEYIRVWNECYGDIVKNSKLEDCHLNTHIAKSNTK